MTEDIGLHWWAIAIRGVVAILVGIAAFAWPGLTLAILVLLVAAFLLVDGVFAVVAGVRSRSWLLVIQGLASLLAGILAWRWPGATALVLLVIVAAWAIVTGALEIVAAFQLRRFIRHEWLLLAIGIVSILLGIALALNPLAGLIAIAWTIGVYALVVGLLSLALAYRLFNHGHALEIAGG